jgi:hypothetical protein
MTEASQSALQEFYFDHLSNDKVAERKVAGWKKNGAKTHEARELRF